MDLAAGITCAGAAMHTDGGLNNKDSASMALGTCAQGYLEMLSPT